MSFESRPPYIAIPKPAISRPKPGAISKPTSPVSSKVSPIIIPQKECPPQTKWHNPIPVQRIRLPDISGLYEQIVPTGSKDEYYPKRLMLQVSTAGQAIIGWFSPPPIKYGSLDLRSWPTGDSNFQANRAGSFVVDTRWKPGGSNEWMMYWDFEKQYCLNTKDPQNLLNKLSDHASEQVLPFGYFRFEIQDGDPVIVLRFSKEAKECDRFKRYHRSVRLPWSLISEIKEQSVKDAVIAEHVQPLSPSYIKKVIDILTGHQAKLLIIKWHTSSNKYARKISRENIIRNINSSPLRKDELPREHRFSLLSRVRAALMSENLTINSETRMFYDWYSKIAAEEAETERPDLELFTNIEVAPKKGQGFAYITSYLKAKASKNLKVGISGSVVGFMLRIRRVPVNFLIAQNGARIFDKDGVPMISNPKDLKNDSIGVQLAGKLDDLLFGFFFDIGAGLGASLDSGLSKTNSKPSFSKKEFNGDEFGSVTFYSYHKLESQDFHMATYNIAALKGPSVKIGNFVGFDIFSTIYHEITLSENRVLSAVVTNTFKPTGPNFPSWNLLFGGMKGLTKYIEGWYKGKGTVDFFSISCGWGIIMSLKSNKSRSMISFSRQNSTLAIPLTKSFGSVLFDRDLATFRIGKGNDITTDGRYVFECWLASMRGLLTKGQNVIEVNGYTSPEAPTCYNLQLSEARVDTVVQAILDAFGNALNKNDFKLSSLGEKPARDSGLDDPPNDIIGLALFKKKYSKQVEHWPFWRRVDISIEGKVLISGFDTDMGDK